MCLVSSSIIVDTPGKEALCRILNIAGMLPIYASTQTIWYYDIIGFTWLHIHNIPQLHLSFSLVLSSGWYGRVVWSVLMCPVIVTGVSHNVTPEQYLHWLWHIASLGTLHQLKILATAPHTTQISLKISATNVEVFNKCIKYRWHRCSKSLLTIYELGTICKCAKLKLMADLHGDTVGNIRSGDTEGHIKTQTLYGDGYISFCHWSVCLSWRSALLVMCEGHTVKTE